MAIDTDLITDCEARVGPTSSVSRDVLQIISSAKGCYVFCRAGCLFVSLSVRLINFKVMNGGVPRAKEQSITFWE